MPDKKGYQFIREVKGLPAENGGTTPVVALTAYARPEDMIRAMNAGFQAHLTIRRLNMIFRLEALIKKYGAGFCFFCPVHGGISVPYQLRTRTSIIGIDSNANTRRNCERQIINNHNL